MVFLFAKDIGLTLDEMDMYTLGGLIDLKIQHLNMRTPDNREDGKPTVRKATQADYDRL